MLKLHNVYCLHSYFLKPHLLHTAFLSFSFTFSNGIYESRLKSHTRKTQKEISREISEKMLWNEYVRTLFICASSFISTDYDFVVHYYQTLFGVSGLCHSK